MWAGVALTNAPQTVIVLHTHCGRKGNKLERRREREREDRENESELRKLEVRIILNYSQASDHSNCLACSPIQYCAFPSFRSKPDEGPCYTKLVPGSNY